MKFNRNKLVVRRIFFSRPPGRVGFGVDRAGSLGYRKKTGIRPKRQVCSAGNGELSHRCPPPGVLPATQLCWDLGLFDQVDGRT